MNVDKNTFADRGRNAVTGDAQVDSHLVPRDLRYLQFLTEVFGNGSRYCVVDTSMNVEETEIKEIRVVDA